MLLEKFTKDACITRSFFGKLVGTYSVIAHLPVRQHNVRITKKQKEKVRLGTLLESFFQTIPES